MSDPQSRPEAEKRPEELSPEARALLARARRSFGISVGLLLIGFMAIAAALVYRATRDDGAPPAAPYAIQALSLPTGAETIAAVAADGLVTVTYRLGAIVQLRVFDGRTGALTQQMDVTAE